MDHDTLLGMINNMALLLALFLIFETFSTRSPDNNNLVEQIFDGIFVGFIGVAVTMNHWHFSMDFRFDVIPVLVSVTGLFFGTVSTLILFMITICFRLFTESGNMASGFLVITVSAVIGLVWRRFRSKPSYNLSTRELYAFGLSVHAAVLICIIAISKNASTNLVMNFSLPIILIFPLGTVMLSKLMAIHIHRKKSISDLLMSNSAYEKSEKLLRLIAESSIPSGDDVFRFLVKQLALSQKKELILIARLDPDERRSARTIAVWRKGGFIENFTYDLKDTPCETLTNQGTCFYPNNVQQLFPDDIMLSEIGAKSYWGTLLRDHSGNDIGIMAIIDTYPMTENSQMLLLFNTFAARAASEMERKNIEDNVSESENRYRLLFQNLNAGFALHEILVDESGIPFDYRFLEMNKAFEQLTGLKARNTIGKTVLECLPGTEKFWIEIYGRVALTGEPVNFDNFSKELEKHFTVTAYSPEKGRFAVIFMDITDIRKSKEEQKRLSIAIEQIEEMVVLTDTMGIIQYANPAFEAITGFSCSEVMGQTPRILKSGQHKDTFYQELWTTILSGHRWKGRITDKRKDGSLYTTECSISPVKNSQENVVGFVWISRDISKEVDLEKRMIQSQKMEAIGVLAGGIAHDFNNILFPLVGWAEMISEELSESSFLEEPVNEILFAAKRARNLVQQILTFSRQAEKEVRPLAVQIIVKEVLKLIRSSLPSTITIERDIDPETSMVLADPTQIHQILMNLTTNAFHAMEESGGTLFVGLKNSVFNNKDWVCITVSDTGVGISESAFDKIFDPYYTTKDSSKGTGLGLAVVHGAVKSYGGEIIVNSKPGLGTRFDIYLPIFDEKDSNKYETFPINLENSPRIENLDGNQHILVIDDEEKILLLLKKMLGRHGYDVHTMNSSLRALDVFKSTPFDFDLVIMDMTMPDMTGDKLAMEMLKIRPDLPIIICSGYNEKLTPDKILSIGVKGMLEKPILKSNLLQMVNSLLDKTL